MLKVPLNPFDSFADAAEDTITLIDGQTIPLAYVSFVPSTYQFIYNQGGKKVDVTYSMKEAQKVLFAGFDPVEWNYRLYNMKTGAGNTGAKLETDTGKLFVQNVAKDLEQKTNLGVSSLASTLGLVVGAYIVYQLFVHSKNS